MTDALSSPIDGDSARQADTKVDYHLVNTSPSLSGLAEELAARGILDEAASARFSHSISPADLSTVSPLRSLSR